MRERFSRQSFLGDASEEILAALQVAIVGIGGGGSHIVQQLAHLGVRNFVLLDPQHIADSNLNRLVGGTAEDVRRQEWKTEIAARVIKNVNPDAKVVQVRQRWQDQAELLRDCDIVVGCVDTFRERDQLERQARRYLTPYLDIGMDVFQVNGEYTITGQVILSLPGKHCMRCIGFLNDNLLAQEAAAYGAAGSRPQVVWSNGALASLAVGVLIELFTPWHAWQSKAVYLEYEGNAPFVRMSGRLPYLNRPCQHFAGFDDNGDPWFTL